MRLVSRGFKDSITWLEGVDPTTRRVRAHNVGRQHTMEEFFKRGGAVDKVADSWQAYNELASDDELVHQNARQRVDCG